jgi:pimeloyl-ACP methyl ester carboxylesterase
MDTRAEADTVEVRGNRLKSIADIRGAGVGPGSTAGLIQGMVPRLLAKGASAAVREKMRAMMARQSAGAVMAAQTAMAKRRDQTDFLSQIRVPTLIVVGDQDSVTPPAVARGMRDRIAGSQLVEIANAGHMTPLEAPEAVNAAIRDFAATVAD